MGQLDLAQLPPSALPDEGVLLFFYDARHQARGTRPADAGGSMLVYEPSAASLQARELPGDLPVWARLPARTLVGYTEMTLPPLHSAAIGGLDLTVEERAAYVALLPEASGPTHRLFGHADAFRGGMELQCQLLTSGVEIRQASALTQARMAELARSSLDWQLLLQLDNDDQVPLAWPDAGRLYVWITAGDLADLAFDRTWTILQPGGSQEADPVIRPPTPGP